MIHSHLFLSILFFSLFLLPVYTFFFIYFFLLCFFLFFKLSLSDNFISFFLSFFVLIPFSLRFSSLFFLCLHRVPPLFPTSVFLNPFLYLIFYSFHCFIRFLFITFLFPLSALYFHYFLSILSSSQVSNITVLKLTFTFQHWYDKHRHRKWPDCILRIRQQKEKRDTMEWATSEMNQYA